MCPMLTAPQNGTISCPLGHTTGSMCRFTCDAGFTLIGSSRRICRTTTAWTGTPTFCRPMQCVPLESPENGFILAPCYHDYTSACSILCSFGYTLQGPRVQTCILNSQIGEVHWTQPPMCNGESFLSTVTALIKAPLKNSYDLQRHLVWSAKKKEVGPLGAPCLERCPTSHFGAEVPAATCRSVGKFSR